MVFLSKVSHIPIDILYAGADSRGLDFWLIHFSLIINTISFPWRFQQSFRQVLDLDRTMHMLWWPWCIQERKGWFCFGFSLGIVERSPFKRACVSSSRPYFVFLFHLRQGRKKEQMNGQPKPDRHLLMSHSKSLARQPQCRTVREKVEGTLWGLKRFWVSFCFVMGIRSCRLTLLPELL